jgi:hypothetical protein
MRREEKEIMMAAVRHINALGGQKEHRKESRPAFRRTNKVLNLDSQAFAVTLLCGSSCFSGIH